MKEKIEITVKAHMVMDHGCGYSYSIDGQEAVVDVRLDNNIGLTEIEMLAAAIGSTDFGSSVLIVTDSPALLDIINNRIYDWARRRFVDVESRLAEWSILFALMVERKVKAVYSTKNRKGSVIGNMREAIKEAIEVAEEEEIEKGMGCSDSR